MNMEILQAIWTSLTTENKLVTDLQGILFISLETFVGVLLVLAILNIKYTKKQIGIYVLCLSLVGILGGFLIPGPYSTFINMLAMPILIKIIFKTTTLKSIVALIIQYFISVTIGLIAINIYRIILKSSYEIYINIPIYRILTSFIQYLLIYLLYLFCKKNRINMNLLDDMNRKTNIILIIGVIVGIIAIAFQSYVGTQYNQYIPFGITILSLVILLTYFFLNLYSLSRTTKLEQTAQSLEEEKLYNKTLSIMYDNIRAFRHDFNNIVQAIGGYISSEDTDGFKTYYNQLLSDCKRVNNLTILSPTVINNPAIYSLLTSKYHTAEEKGITVSMEIFLDLNAINMKIYEFTRALGILLDNAIEAANKCNDKKINIIMRKSNNPEMQLVIVENTYMNKDVNTEKIFEKGESSKTEDKEKHGLGLWEIRKILNKNNNLNLFTSKDSESFKQQLEIFFE